MFILISLLLLDVQFSSTPLDSVQNQWAIGTRVFGLDRFAVMWTPSKTFAMGANGYITSQIMNNEEKGGSRTGKTKSETWSIGLGAYTYFMPDAFISPFIGLSPYLQKYHYIYEYFYESGDTTIHDDNTYTLGASLIPGAEYFFKLEGKQLSARITASLVTFSRSYTEDSSYYSNNTGNSGSTTGANNYFNFYSPTDISVSTYIMLHFR